MSMVVPASRDPVELHERKPLSASQKLFILDRQNDKCPACGFGLVAEDGACLPMIDEHILPLWLGGTNDLSNRALYCIPCAKAKTKKEATERGKVLRLERDHNPQTRRQSPNKLRGRGFRKADPLK